MLLETKGRPVKRKRDPATKAVVLVHDSVPVKKTNWPTFVYRKVLMSIVAELPELSVRVG